MEPVDLSNVLYTNNIGYSPALMDRMELIELSGYTEDEKQHISHEHLIKKCLGDNGLGAKELALMKRLC